MNKFLKYCTGCGLCKSLNICDLEKDEKGFLHPNQDNDFFSNICPISGVHTNKLDLYDVWGRNEAVYLGWSNNSKIREKASSGGVITELACYLLNSKKVDSIIHIGADPNNPTKTKLFFSTSPEEIVSHSGSRYCISSPLSEISNIESGKKYAFIGKPCDVVVLRNYMEFNPKLNGNIPYLISFFCMGLPSDLAQIKLLNKLKCNDCITLDYRGNGWPGYATALDSYGKKHKVTYDESWGEILGRDLMPACKFCIDGIGEMADISCGDAWYLNSDNTPDFSEHDGRNVIFARTSKGYSILQEMQNKSILTIEKYDKYKKELPLIQTSQLNRRRELKARILAMKLLLQEYPKYNKKLLKNYSKELTIKHQFRIFLGTIKRFLNGKM